ncbi:MAG: septum site-determining protein MinD [Clostridia bacterium]|nr:septum site-determining protein MinD [Clostridia bacterium]
MARTIVITSGKGGVGKTTITANLGRCLASLGERVAVIDADIGLNNLDVVLGIDTRIVFDLVDVIEGRCRIRQALIEDVEQPGMFIMPSAHSYDRAMINGQNVKEIVLRLAQSYDYVLVDCPAGIEAGFKRAVASCDEAVVVTTPHISSVRDAETVMSLLKKSGINRIFTVVNRVRGDLVLSGEMLTRTDVERLTGVEVFGMIPDEDEMNLLSNSFNSGITEGYTACLALARGIRSGTPEIYDLTKKYRGLFGKIRRSIKRKL